MKFAILMFLATLGLAVSAGYLSVTGFAMTFSNTFWQAFALASSLEIGKLICASFLYRYWTTIHSAMRIGMVTVVIGLMLFTSASIYGYLSASYQSSSLTLNSNNSQLTSMQDELTRDLARKTEIDKQISQLPINYVGARQKLQKSFGPELDQINNRITLLNGELLTLKGQTIKDEAHVGPIIFVAKTMGMSSDAAMSWFIFLVVLVFDPLAVMMTLGTNHVLLEARREKDKKMFGIQPAQVVPLTTTIAPIEPVAVVPMPAEPIGLDDPLPTDGPLPPIPTLIDPLADEEYEEDDSGIDDRLARIERAVGTIASATQADQLRRQMTQQLRTNTFPK